ncbi:MAG: tetratricopeptide repeat protein [Ignavibacteriaceae bacterium]|nr:tetratricopeptide repeat protein [Ignavibacteriaceae bacterium]
MPDFLERILSLFFKEDEYRELIKKYQFYLNSTPEPKVSSLKFSNGKKQKIVEVNRSWIDFSITFAKNNLPQKKFVEFLFYLGESAVSIGELNAAQDVYLMLKQISEKNAAFENIAAYSMLALGDIYSRQALWQMSEDYIFKANKLFSKQKDLKGCARCENLLGTIYGDKGNILRAKNHFEKSLSFLNPTKDIGLIGMLEMNLGILCNIQNNYDLAYTYFQRAVLKFEKLNDFRRIAELKHNLGMMFSHKGEYQMAIKEFDAGILICLNKGLKPILVLSYLSKAFVYIQLNDYSLARAYADNSLKLSFLINDRLSIADNYKIKGIIERNLNNYQDAEDYLLTSLRLNTELDNIMNIAESAFELTLLYNEIGKTKKAKVYQKMALDNFKAMDAVEMIKKAQEAL